MVQLRIKTELQEDYVVLQDFQLPKAVPQSSNSRYGAQCLYPTFTTAIDENGLLTVVYSNYFSAGSGGDIVCIYKDAKTSQWRQDNANLQGAWTNLCQTVQNAGQAQPVYEEASEIEVVRDPKTNRLHVVFGTNVLTLAGPLLGHFWWATSDVLWHINLNDRFPQWRSKIVLYGSTQDISQTTRNLQSAVTLATQLPFIEGKLDRSLAATFEADQLSISCRVTSGPIRFISQPFFGQGMAWHTETNLSVPVETLDMKGPWSSSRPGRITRLCRGYFQDISSDPTGAAQLGYYVALDSVDSNHPDKTGIYRITDDKVALEIAPNDGDTEYWTQADFVFLDDPNTAPLIFATTDSRVCFLPNVVYDKKTTPIIRDIFVGGMPGPGSSPWRKPVWVRGAIRNTQQGSSNNTVEIHAFVLFENPADSSYELWHTATIPGAVYEINDGVFDCLESSWTDANLVTKDILGPRNYIFLPPMNPVSLLINDDQFLCTVVTSDRKFRTWSRTGDSGIWTSETIESRVSSARMRSVPRSRDTQVSQEHIYFVDITTLTPDGTVIPGLQGKLSADEPVSVTINGEDIIIRPGRSVDVAFNSSGRIGISTLMKEDLIAPVYSVWVEGMAADAKVDIQPSPGGFHDTMASIGTSDQTQLQNITLRDGTKLTTETDPAILEGATNALHSIADVMTGDAEATPDDQQYIYKSTSLQVARARPMLGSTRRRLGLVRKFQQPKAFIIDFRGGLKHRTLNAEELTAVKADLRKSAKRVGSDGRHRAPDGFFDFIEDVGDFFSNVANAVYDVAVVVIETVAEGVKATLHFLEETVMNVWEGVLTAVADVANFAIMVFDAIKTGIEKLVEWLKFLFAWDDIKKSAKALRANFDAGAPLLVEWANKLASEATGPAFHFLKDNAASAFDTAAAVFGGETFAQDVEQTVLTNRGSSQLGGPAVVKSVYEIIDALPSAASWLLDKFLGLFDIDLELRSDAGIRAFQSSLGDIVANLLSQSTQDDFEAAVATLNTLLIDVSSRSIFDAKTIADFIRAVKALAILGLDVLQDLINAIVKLFTYMASNIVQVFSTSVDIVGISSLYEYIMDEDCTVAGMCSLVVAVPFTILYKAITGETPFEESTPKDGKALPLPSDSTLHKVMGVLGILTTMWNVMDDLTGAKLIGEMKAFIGGASIGSLAGLTIHEVDSVGTAAPGKRQRALMIPQSVDDVPALDDIVHSLHYFNWGVTLIRLGLNLHGSQPSAFEWGNFVAGGNSNKGWIKCCYGIQALGSLLTFILTFISVGKGPYDDLANSSILSSTQGTMNVYKAVDFRHPVVTAVVVLVKFSTGMGGNVLLIKSASAENVAEDGGRKTVR